MSLVCGIDGCTGGWLAVNYDLETMSVTWRLCHRARDFLNFGPMPDVVAIDIPIGLPERGSRQCDAIARKLLGAMRGTSVFPSPLRSMLSAGSYQEACTIGASLSNKKISQQAWSLVPKIRDVDDTIREQSELRVRIREIHPEVSFYHLAGEKPLVDKKSSREGQMQRAKLLRQFFGERIDTALSERRRFGCEAHDVLDAFAAAWTAARIVRGQSMTIPASPEYDATGLPMMMFA